MKDGVRFSSYKYGKVEAIEEQEFPDIIDDNESIESYSSTSPWYCRAGNLWNCFLGYVNNITFSVNELQTSVTDEQFEDLKHAFIAFDWNNDGYIDADDLRCVMKKLGHDISQKEIKKVFKDICKTSTRKLDFEGFVEMMAQDASYLAIAKSEDEVKTAFQFIDQNKDGLITIEELQGRFQNCLSEEEAARLIKEADKNGDGVIDFEEFKEIMSNDELGIQLVQSEIELYS